MTPPMSSSDAAATKRPTTATRTGGATHPRACPMLLTRVTGETVTSDLDWFGSCRACGSDNADVNAARIILARALG